MRIMNATMNPESLTPNPTKNGIEPEVLNPAVLWDLNQHPMASPAPATALFQRQMSLFGWEKLPAPLNNGCSAASFLTSKLATDDVRPCCLNGRILRPTGI